MCSVYTLNIMLSKHFNVIIQSEENTIAFLKEKRLIEIIAENLLVHGCLLKRRKWCYRGKILCCIKKK